MHVNDSGMQIENMACLFIDETLTIWSAHGPANYIDQRNYQL